MEIRTAVPDDADAVVELWRRFGGPTGSAPDRAAPARLLARDPEALLVAEVGGTVVGTLVVGWDGWRCHLYRLAVDDAHRRRGIGRALLDAGLDHARRLGATRVDAMVADANAGGVAFWAAGGFVVDDDDRRWSLEL